MIRSSWWPAWMIVALLGWVPLLLAPAPWWFLAGAICYVSATMALVGFHVEQHGKGRLPRGRCCWCRRRRAVRWQHVAESRPGHTAMEGRCWLHWSFTPAADRSENPRPKRAVPGGAGPTCEHGVGVLPGDDCDPCRALADVDEVSP